MLIWAFFIWEFWKKAMTEYTKNYLFDLRDSLRAWFIEKGYGLEHPSYRAAREMLNAVLWHTGRASYLEYLIFRFTIKRYPEWAQERQEHFNKMLFSSDPVVDEYVKTVRERASYAIGSYIISKSFIVLSVSALAGVCFAIVGAMAETWRFLKINLGDFIAPIPRYAGALFMAIMAAAFPIKPSSRDSVNTLESWSLNARMVAERALNKA